MTDNWVARLWHLDSSHAKESSLSSEDDNSNKSQICRRNFFAALLNIGLGISAVVAIDYLGNVIILLRSLVGTPIALIHPPIVHNILVKDACCGTHYANYLVLGIGGFATIVACNAIIVNWNEGGES